MCYDFENGDLLSPCFVGLGGANPVLLIRQMDSNDRDTTTLSDFGQVFLCGLQKANGELRTGLILCVTKLYRLQGRLLAVSDNSGGW